MHIQSRTCPPWEGGHWMKSNSNLDTLAGVTAGGGIPPRNGAAPAGNDTDESPVSITSYNVPSPSDESTVIREGTTVFSAVTTHSETTTETQPVQGPEEMQVELSQVVDEGDEDHDESDSFQDVCARDSEADRDQTKPSHRVAVPTGEPASITMDDGSYGIEIPVMGRALATLVIPGDGNGDELLKNRFLCRGGGLLLAGPTGIGKSSLALQAAISWTLNQSCFGIAPKSALRVAIIQAENDDGDLVEMRDGVKAGIVRSQGLTLAEVEEACQRIQIYTEDRVSGQCFGEYLDAILTQAPEKPDLVIVDPVLAFVGADVSSQERVSKWLRQGINPVIHQHGVGLILVHHTNKPASSKEQKAAWQAGDFAYLGAGSAEWCNWARAVLALRSIGSDSVFELRAAKRGKRIGWRDADGNAEYTKMVAHGTDGGICWREATAEEKTMLTLDSLATGKPKTTSPIDHLVPGELMLKDRSLPVTEFRAFLQKTRKIGSNVARDVVRIGLERGTWKKVRLSGRNGIEVIGLPGHIDVDVKKMNDGITESRDPFRETVKP